MPPLGHSFRYFKYTKMGWELVSSAVVNETTVSLTVNGEVWLQFQCTPLDLEALAVGFLFNEGFISDASEVVIARACESGENVDVWLNHAVQKPTTWKKTSGCNGGMARVNSPLEEAHFTQPIISPDQLLDCMDQLLEAQEMYHQARGIHCSALSDGKHVLFRAEDIGRHNTLDKLAGQLLLHPANIHPRIVLTTGRVSSEMLQKSSRMLANIVLSRTSPTVRSIQLADELGITLIGYARRTQMFIYTHPERINGFSLESISQEEIYTALSV